MAKPHILFFITEDWYFWSHRRSVAIAALDKGYKVTVVTRVHQLGSEIESAGMNLIPINIKRSSLNPFVELKTLLDIFSIYRKAKPDIVHQVGTKPIVYGTWAARIFGICGIVNAFGGFGHLFTAVSGPFRRFRKLIILIYRWTLAKTNIRLILQNSTDIQHIIDHKISSKNKTVLIRGAGVDLDEYQYSMEPAGIPVVMYAGRMLWSKGVGNLVKAAEILSKRNVNCRVVIIGRPDPENPLSIPQEKLEEWNEDGHIEWWGYKEDMPKVIAESTLLVLPTFYGEGVPKILLEAAAVGRPIITTDIPGCRDIVHDGVNGLLIPGDDIEVLASAIQTLLKYKEWRVRFGLAGRNLVENEFSSRHVSQATLEIYEELLDKC